MFTHESVQVVYNTTHQYDVGMGTTTLHKIMPNEDPMDMRDQFEPIGEMKWQLIIPLTFRLNGQEMKSSEFLPPHGMLRRKRPFTGPDGCPYRWDMLVDPAVLRAPLDSPVVVLLRDDPSRTEVARYQRGSQRIVGPKRKPLLQVDSGVQQMLDLIALTFVYVEKIRMDKDNKRTVA